MELVKSGPGPIGKVQVFQRDLAHFDQLHREYGGPPKINLTPLDFEYPPLLQVYTFFWWRLQLIHGGKDE